MGGLTDSGLCCASQDTSRMSNAKCGLVVLDFDVHEAGRQAESTNSLSPDEQEGTSTSGQFFWNTRKPRA